MRLERLSSGHHGRIKQVRNVAGFKFFETWYESAATLPAHYHDRACVCVVVSGSFHEDFKRHRLQFNPRAVAFRPAGEMHSDHFGNTGAHCLVIELPETWISRLRHSRQECDGPVGVQSGQLPWLGTRLYREYKLADEVSPLVIEGIMLEIAGGFSRSLRDVERAVPRWLETARETVRAEYRRPPKLQELALRAGVHPVHLAREFRRRYKCTVGEYVRQLRINAACEKLAHSVASIAEIALDMGFSHQAHFARTFTRFTGMPPSRFRGQQR